MPEETMVSSTDVQSTLENLEDYSLENSLCRIQNYKVMQNALENDELGTVELERLLAVCVHDAPVLKYTTTVVNIIQVILSKVKVGRYDPAPDLVPSALAVMRVIKVVALFNIVESLIVLCFDTLLSYPEDSLVPIAENYDDVIETFDLCCNVKIVMKIRLQACSLLHKFLKKLPKDKKKIFVEKGISVWFAKIIPTVMDSDYIVEGGPETQMILEILELLTDDLIDIDYSYNPPWYNILECICNTKKYPALMKTLLQSGNDAWHRLWIVFIKLLKHQITQSLSSVGTPINSMLPVVEAAFKLDVPNRCKAFECWMALIDSFSTETNESNINKRIKLLIIPLKSNNAKAEETALAKFKCWWRLITKFQNKMDKFLDTVLVSFLHFCFGRHHAMEKPILVPGHISANVKKQCNQAIVEMVGHVNCDGCTDLPRLTSKVINTKHLVDNWNHWIYSLTSVIMRTAKNDNGLTKRQMTCLWQSFLMTIGELPENNIRKDLFSEILAIVAKLVQECESNNQFLHIAFNILILSLFDEDTKIKQLFKSQNDANEPLYRIIKTVLDPSLYGLYKSLPGSELVTKFGAVTKLVVDERICSPKDVITWFLTTFPAADFVLMFWTALVESICESEYDKYLHVTHDMILWPLKSMNSLIQLEASGITWYKYFDIMYPKLCKNKTDIYNEISQILFSTLQTSGSNSTVYFELCIVLAMLKHRFTSDNSTTCENEINLLLNLTKSIDSYEYFGPILPMLVDRLVAIMCIVTSNVNDFVAALILVCVKNVLHVLTQACEQQTDVTHIMMLISNLLKPLEALFAVESYSKLIFGMTYNLLLCSPLLSKHSSTRNIILPLMKTILSKTDVADPNYDKIQSLIADIEQVKTDKVVKAVDQKVENNKFTTPQTKQAPKRVKKKEPSIVNTVVENGEEYVVVKSNWKFNPRKLTENQKEKLQRKREDIPALYQDLSQSQDEFKLVSWKTDSQDTTSSSKSESKSNKPDNKETTAEILVNLPNTNIVPKIFETLLSENEKNDSNVKVLPPKDHVNKTEASTPSPKNTKSPRMALKDRVFRNVRNLMESSGIQKENKDSSEDQNKIDDGSKTPVLTKNNISSNIVNSAPPLLSADRPSRVKRKPKKFEDLQLLMGKKRRLSHDVQSDRVDKSNEVVTLTKNSSNKDTDDMTDVHTPTKNKPDDSQESAKIANISMNAQEENNGDNNNKVDTNDTEGSKKATQLNVNSEPNDSISLDNIEREKCPDIKDVSTPKSSKSVTEITVIKENSTPKSSKNITEMTATKDASTPKSSKRGTEVTATKDTSTPKSSKNVIEIMATKDALTPKLSKSVIENITTKDDSTPKSSKNVTEITAPNLKSNSVTEITAAKDVSTPKTPKDLKKVFTPRRSTVKNLTMSKISKATNEVSTPMISKEPKEVSSPIITMSTDVKDVSTPKVSKDIKEHPISKTSNVKEGFKTKSAKGGNKEILTPIANKNVKEVSVSKLSADIGEVSTPSSSEGVNEISTAECSEAVQEISAPIISKDIIAESRPKTPKPSKEAPTSIITKEVKNGTTPKLIKDVKELSTPISKDSKQVTTLKTSKENEVGEVSTPKHSPKGDEQKSAKKSTVKKSRIEKELAIDMVEGHPYLKIQSEKRLTRKALESAGTGRRSSLAGKLNKSRSELKTDRKTKEKNMNKESENTSATSVVVDESQEKDSEPSEQTSFSDELPYSDDVIESSQDSTMTTISVKSTRKTPKKVPVVCVEKMIDSLNKVTEINNSQSILDRVVTKLPTSDQESKDDSVLPLNKTVVEQNIQDDLTENMDTEPMEARDISDDVILINECAPPISLSSDDAVVGPESQVIAEADTQPTDPKEFVDMDITQENIPTTPEMTTPKVIVSLSELSTVENNDQSIAKDLCTNEKPADINNTENNVTVTLSESACADIEQAGASSPFKDEAQRQQDFLNNTIEISPIKSMSPDRNKKSPSPETSSDYVVIKLTSPVHSNGEPFEKCDSPEVFTEDKISPDKRDQSPPRVEISVTNTSPSSSLSLKKNRPQVRSGGRAAQMLGLCVPDKVQAIVNPERNETEEVKKTPSTTPARRNLRILYNTVNDNTESSSSNSASENDDSENFLKFRRSLPTVDCSPSGPILKRKLVEITDDSTISPASKRKRVSFHDPPVSTTISVQKYIEPGGVRSPQNSAQKRLERQLRQHTPLKSPKRLENVFKLDTALTKTVESFSESNDVIVIADDTQGCSLDETPVVEIVRASELNNTDPICPDLLDCTDPISNIAGELSSPAMKSLLVKELEGKIETIGDLAKMTELDVNRLCIKAPKVKVVKKVLADYVAKLELVKSQMKIDEAVFDEPMSESQLNSNVEVQTDRNESMEMEVQTEWVPTAGSSTQTDTVTHANTSIQTDESGSKSTKDIIKSCLSEKTDFVEELGQCLEESSIKQLSNKLLLNTVTDLLMKKITPSDTKQVLDRIIKQDDKSKELSFVRDYLCDRFESKDLLLLCSQILKVVYDRPA